MSNYFIKIINNENSKDYISLNKKEALALELKLNVTKNAKEWSYIGDLLFNFQAFANENDELIVSQEQIDYLKMLNKKDSFYECYNL